ncbi:MAG: MoaD/ThiS family protein [Bacillota bacterium]
MAQEREIQVADGSTVADLLATFRLPEVAVVAVVNGQVTDLQQTLVEDDRVLLVPPVSGGSGAVWKVGA